MTVNYLNVQTKVNALMPSVLDKAFKGGLWPHRVLPQMPTNMEFGEGECDVGTNIFISVQVEVVLPPFSDRRSLRDANGGS